MRSHFAWWGTLAAGLLLQTIVLTPIVGDAWRPDFTRALVLWVALTGRPKGGALLAFAAGMIVDALSGSPLGFTAFLRLCIYGIARPARGVLEHSPVVFFLGPVAVLAETVLVWLMSALAFSNKVDLAVILGVGLRQGLIEVFAVPLVFVTLEFLSGYRTEWGVKLDPR